MYASAQRHRRPTIGLVLISALVSLLALHNTFAQPLPGNKPSILTGPRFLPVDQAFRYYTSLPAAGVLAVHWEIAPEYYLYQEKFNFTVMHNGAPLKFTVSLPEGRPHSDEFFGDVQVYFENMAAQLRFEGAVPQGEIVLLIEYQGCAEAGFCYTLQQREIPLVL